MRDLPIGAHRVRCVACGRNDRDKTMGVTVDHEGAVFHCFRCSAAGAERQQRQYIRTAAARTIPTIAKLDWSTTAETIWNRTQPLHGTLGATYLRRRGCVLPPRDSHLRYLPPDGKYPPTLTAAITDAISGKAISLHFTKLANDGHGKTGTDRDKTLLAGHRKRGGVIRLWPNESVSTGLCVAEGIETALAAAHAYTPVWSCVDAGNLADLPVMAGIESITIIADHDDAGLRAAAIAGQRWADAGREAVIVTPDSAGHDLCDLAVAS